MMKVRGGARLELWWNRTRDKGTKIKTKKKVFFKLVKNYLTSIIKNSNLSFWKKKVFFSFAIFSLPVSVTGS